MRVAPVLRVRRGVGESVRPTHAVFRGLSVLLLVLAVLVAGCGTQATPSSPPTVAPTTAATSAPSPTATPTVAPVEPDALYGVWEGVIGEGANAYPLVLRFYDCEGATCGESEYGRPDDPVSVLCAAELKVGDAKDGAFDAVEELTFQPWECFPTTLSLRPGADGVLDVEQYGDRSQPPFATGTFRRTADDGRRGPVVVPGPVAGLGTPTASADLDGSTTQYTADGFGSLWLPITQGAVVRVDAATGQVVGRLDIGDPPATELRSDPHAVAAADDGIWVPSVAEHALVLIDPATMTLGRRIPLDVEPYAIAIDGRRAWVTSFADDALVSVDLDAGAVLSTTDVPKPTGVAVGAGSVWVVAHRENRVLGVNPKTAKVDKAIELGLPSPSPVCGACVENIVVANGSVWTSDNEARSVTRIDPVAAVVAERIELPMRVWAVAVGGGRVWAGQFDDAYPSSAWQIAAIAPQTNEATGYPLPAYSVAWAGGVLWTVVPAGRTDVLTRVELED